ncbi:MAG: 50S ribosomal protein L10 [Solirubrobacteraceae bacterium]
MNRDQKAAVVQEIAADIEGAEAVFAVDYRGISVPQAAELRTKLREADASFRIVKNSLTERAADQAGADALRELLEGPTALTFVRGDAALAAKALNDFRRANDLLEFKGGTMNGETLSVDQIVAIARLPAREVLHAQLVGTVAAPLTGLVRGLNALIAGLAIQLAQIAEQGLVTGEAPAEAEAAEPEAAPEPEAAEPEAEAAPEAEAGPEAEAAPEAAAEPETEPAAEASPDAEATGPEPDQANEADAPAAADDHDAAEAKEDA